MTLAAAFITLTLAAHAQPIFGQINAGNGLSAESNTIAPQQQSQKPNIETTVINAENIGNTRSIKFITGTDYKQPHVNKTTAILNGNTISNIKFMKNQAYGTPALSRALPTANSNGLAPQSPQGSFRSVYLNANPMSDHLNGSFQILAKQPESNVAPQLKSPLYFTFGPPSPTSSPTHPSFLANIQPMLSSVHFVPHSGKLQNTASLQPPPPPSPASPAQEQAPQQTFASFLIPSTNVQSQAKLLFAQARPASPPTQPAMPTPDNTAQNRHSLTSLLLSHLLTQSSKIDDHSTPIVKHHPNQNSKPSNIKALLPLLLSLLDERNNCCECGKCQRNKNCNSQKTYKGLEESSLETNSMSYTNQRSEPARPAGGAGDYSGESMEYSDEYYEED